ncbi:MAG: hypothetical protein QXX56_00040 [Candidatus Bathyarchaeia archaeon]
MMVEEATIDKTINCEDDYKWPEEFERILINAVDDGLNLLGETVKAVLLLLIKERYKIEKHEIPKKPGEFSSALRSILGNEGGRFIEKVIVKCLYSRLGLGIPEGNKELHEYMLEAYRKIRNNLRKEF